ncbi:hypothetical protein [Allochromatium humboldtianum]|uniref:hypothetical protein n=1 Tax=Allochromatium humboldtianum TaxID=504901 RepID=UPI001CA42D95|nr:hypothetical protein [Allochromatium humboldtianum]
MNTKNFRKVGGSVMLAVPPAFLDQRDQQVSETGMTDLAGHELTKRQVRIDFRACPSGRRSRQASAL